MSLRAKVYIVGAGPGDPELITVKGMRILETTTKREPTQGYKFKLRYTPSDSSCVIPMYDRVTLEAE